MDGRPNSRKEADFLKFLRHWYQWKEPLFKTGCQMHDRSVLESFTFCITKYRLEIFI